jgi:DNA-binding response OmpR family regulator
MKNRNILIVADNFRVADTLSRAIQREFGEEASVEVFRTAETALKMLSAKPFDLLITDWQLPGMSGLELILKTHLVNPNMKIIFMTAYTSKHIEERIQEIVDLYLPKPFRIPVLIGHIHHLFSREVVWQA